MKNLFFVLIVALIAISFTGCKNNAKLADEGLTNLTVTVDSFLASPETWAGKEVVITRHCFRMYVNTVVKSYFFSAPILRKP
ncbi:MAG: hypothetical protein HC905_15630 [Bacteroidales bacterium]|nr:hypothetical protein [Bacteroidales bacterium]